MLAYHDSGTGFPILLIHGFCESKSVWYDFVPMLNQHFRVITPDLYGFGESTPPPENLTIEALAEAIHDIVEKLQLPQVILVGHSLGGYVSLAFAKQFPHKVAGLGMFHSTAFADTTEKKQARNAAIENIAKNGTEPFVRALIPSLFSNAQKDKCRAVIERLIAEAKMLTPETLIRTTAAMRDRSDYIEVLTQAHFPVLFIVGKDDIPVPLNSSLAQCYLPPESHVLILGRVGHHGIFEAPELTLRSILDFANRIILKY